MQNIILKPCYRVQISKCEFVAPCLHLRQCFLRTADADHLRVFEMLQCTAGKYLRLRNKDIRINKHNKFSARHFCTVVSAYPRPVPCAMKNQHFVGKLLGNFYGAVLASPVRDNYFISDSKLALETRDCLAYDFLFFARGDDYG